MTAKKKSEKDEKVETNEVEIEETVAEQGTVADHDETGTAPESHAGDNVDTNAGK